MVKINLASGKDYREGYTNIDNCSMFNGKVDVQDDVFEIDWLKNNVDEILLCHFMMYIDTFQAPILFKRWHRWLRKGGELIIETGDLKKIAKTILFHEDPKTINGTNGVMQLFGWDNTKGHTWAWCEQTLIPLLEEAGFKIVDSYNGGLHNRPERDITIKAKKI